MFYPHKITSSQQSIVLVLFQKLYLQIEIEMANRKQNEISLKLKLNQFITENGTLTVVMKDINILIRTLPMSSLHSCIASHKNVMKNIKWLILTHHLILQTSCRWEQIHQLLDKISLGKGPFTSMDEILIQKFISPYKSYLYKRNIVQLKASTNEPQIYPLINTIRKGVSFIDILYTIGRYLSKQHPFLIDFNLIIAKDTSYLYNCLKNRLTEEIAIQNADVLEDINQKLYIVFYNCYFSKSMSKLAPVWINTEKLFARRKKTSTKLSNHNVISQNKLVNKAFCEDNHDEISNISLEIEDDDAFKSASTIATKNDEDDIQASRREFITLAEKLVHIIDSKGKFMEQLSSLTLFN